MLGNLQEQTALTTPYCGPSKMESPICVTDGNVVVSTNGCAKVSSLIESAAVGLFPYGG